MSATVVINLASMRSDLRVRLSSDAQRDFDEILDYTFQLYGEFEEGAYRQRIESALTSIGAFPLSGKVRPEYGEGIRARIVAEHQIIYRVTETEVLVYEIRHLRRDAPDPR